MDAYLIRSRVSSPFPVPPLNVARPIARVLLARARTFERTVLVAPLRQSVRSRGDLRFVLSLNDSGYGMRACARPLERGGAEIRKTDIPRMSASSTPRGPCHRCV